MDDVAQPARSRGFAETAVAPHGSAMAGLDPDQVRRLIIVPTLTHLGLPGGAAAVQLLLGTIAQESGFRALEQFHGPALGLYQIEPATHKDVLDNFAAYRAPLLQKLHEISGPFQDDADLVVNLAYATAIARLIYYRAEEPLPEADHVARFAGYWKRHYNPGGAGTAQEFVDNYHRYLGG